MTPLQDEIANDPESMGYSGKSAAEVLALMNNDALRPRREIVPMCDVVDEVMDITEFDALDEAIQLKLVGYIGSLREVRPSGYNFKLTLLRYFGAGSQTASNLAAFSTISRASELNITPTLHQIEVAING